MPHFKKWDDKIMFMNTKSKHARLAEAMAKRAGVIKIILVFLILILFLGLVLVYTPLNKII